MRLVDGGAVGGHIEAGVEGPRGPLGVQLADSLSEAGHRDAGRRLAQLAESGWHRAHTPAPGFPRREHARGAEPVAHRPERR